MSPSADVCCAGGRLRSLRGAILCTAVFLTTLVWSFQWTAFAEVKTAALAASVLALSLGALAGRQLPRGGAYAFLPLWVFLGYANAVAHIRPAYSLALTGEENLRILLILLTPLLGYDLLAVASWQARIKGCIIVAGVLAAALGILQYLGLVPFLFPVFPNYTQPVYSVFGNQDLFGGFLAISLTLAVLRGFKQQQLTVPWLAFLLLLTTGLALSASRSAWLAAAAGVLTAILIARPFPRRMAICALALGVPAVCLAFAVPEQTIGRVLETFSAGDDGGRLRLWFWDGTWRMFTSSPWFGKGLGNFAFYSPRYLGAALLAPGGGEHAWNELHTDNAHCDPLELLAETGLLGALLLLWMVVRLLRCRGEEWAALVALAVFSLFNAAFQSAPHALTGILLAAMLLSRRYPPGAPRGMGAALMAGAAAAAGTAVFLIAVFVPSYYLRAAEDIHVAGGDPVAAYQRAIATPWPQPVAREELAIALIGQGRYEDAEAQLRAAMQDLDTGRMYYLLGQVAEARQDQQAARDWALACLLRWPWHRQSWDLLKATSDADQFARWQVRFRGWAPALL